jgi:hypothetical protein
MTWTPITEFPGYEISREGVVRSWVGRGKIRSVKKPHDITPIWLEKQGRWAVRLVKDGVRHLRCVANLMLTTFVSEVKDGTVVFKDEDPTNLALENLSWKASEF